MTFLILQSVNFILPIEKKSAEQHYVLGTIVDSRSERKYVNMHRIIHSQLKTALSMFL